MEAALTDEQFIEQFVTSPTQVSPNPALTDEEFVKLYIEDRNAVVVDAQAKQDKQQWVNEAPTTALIDSLRAKATTYEDLYSPDSQHFTSLIDSFNGTKVFSL